MTALAMFIGRYPIIYFSLAISGSFAAKQRLSNQIVRHTQSSIELSLFLLITVILVGAIMFLPLMILGPLLEFITM
ncbi:Potassium-transporting ATPase subunit A N-terminal domain protein [Candidatus Megaera venefica]|uniref:Potassium-transporting ATPase subunit A N-terminal domain protein n=2 Tax=Candidatus Megaera venefica TaxID=2055910 RepID=A0ABU5NDW7_9RICK|nr:Potassium-transporting ATPase subunit A N-terminal domain protein [Candidatus Megaera venefica]